MTRQHDIQVLSEDSDALAEGTFRVVLTRSHRVVTAIDIPDSALGPLHLVFAVSPGAITASSFATGSLFSGLGHAVGHLAGDLEHAAGATAEGTFNAASKVATTVARPAFDITRDAAAVSAKLVSAIPMPEAEREKIKAASHTILRARLGDVNAQQFIRAVGTAAKAGVREAQKTGDALLTGTRVVAHVVDAPLSLVSKVPVVCGALHGLDPLVKMDHMTAALQRGDFAGLKRMVEGDLKMAEGIINYIPGIGTGVGAAIGAGLAVLDGGGPLDVAIHTAYGAIPVPPGIRQITDGVVDTVLRLIHHGSLTDAAIAGARNAAPAGIARDVFDTLAKIILHHRPILHAAEDLVGTYVKRYAPEIPVPSVVTDVITHAKATIHDATATGKALDFAAKQLGRGHIVSVVSAAANVAPHAPSVVPVEAHVITPPPSSLLRLPAPSASTAAVVAGVKL